MGLWAIWTWSQQQEQERLTERTRLAAMYVNPFMSACEDLQSRIYSVLELGGLRTLRKRYPNGGYAEEILYLIVRYFGWAAALSRYSPYSQDPVVIRLAEAVKDAFATTGPGFPVGAFNFFHPEQKALGKMVMSRMQGQDGMELDTISSYTFSKRLASLPFQTVSLCSRAWRRCATRRTWSTCQVGIGWRGLSTTSSICCTISKTGRAIASFRVNGRSARACGRAAHGIAHRGRQRECCDVFTRRGRPVARLAEIRLGGRKPGRPRTITVLPRER
jgi:hypothetical protein